MVWQIPHSCRVTRLLPALFVALSMGWAGGVAPVGAQRSRESTAVLGKFLEDAAARGVAEQDITRAVFEGRLNPDYRDLELVREGLARDGDPFPAASGGREWIRRFGSIGALQKVHTAVNGVAVVWSGRDILTHAAITSLRVSDRGDVGYRYPELRRLPDSWRMRFDDVAAHLKNEPGALDEFTAYLGELDQQTDAVKYFGYSDRRSPDGETSAGLFDARLDYDTLRTAKYLRELAGQPPLPLNRAATAGEREARRPQLEVEPWSYTHGAGFGISDALRARETAALRGKTLVLDVLVAALGAPSGPVDTLLAAGRRADAEQILKTLPGWTAARLAKSYRFADYRSRDFLDAVMRGEFEPWLGRQPEGPNGLKDRARGWYLDLAFAGYHGVFETACPSAPGNWVAWTTWIETTQIGPFGPTGPPTIDSKITVNIREPYLRPVTLRAKAGRMAKSDFAAEILRAQQSGELQNLKALLGEFTRFLKDAGCTSDVTRQFEVNFYLLAEGFPPLQVLLPGVDLLAERARRPASSAAAPLPPPPAAERFEPASGGARRPAVSARRGGLSRRNRSRAIARGGTSGASHAGRAGASGRGRGAEAVARGNRDYRPHFSDRGPADRPRPARTLVDPSCARSGRDRTLRVRRHDDGVGARWQRASARSQRGPGAPQCPVRAPAVGSRSCGAVTPADRADYRHRPEVGIRWTPGARRTRPFAELERQARNRKAKPNGKAKSKQRSCTAACHIIVATEEPREEPKDV